MRLFVYLYFAFLFFTQKKLRPTHFKFNSNCRLVMINLYSINQNSYKIKLPCLVKVCTINCRCYHILNCNMYRTYLCHTVCIYIINTLIAATRVYCLCPHFSDPSLSVYRSHRIDYFCIISII